MLRDVCINAKVTSQEAFGVIIAHPPQSKNGSLTKIVSSRSGLVLTSATGQSISSTTCFTHLISYAVTPATPAHPPSTNNNLNITRIGGGDVLNDAVARDEREFAYARGRDEEAIAGVFVPRCDHDLCRLAGYLLFDRDDLCFGGCDSLTKPLRRGGFAEMRTTSDAVLLRGNRQFPRRYGRYEQRPRFLTFANCDQRLLSQHILAADKPKQRMCVEQNARQG
jgi:hypothetical protein